MKYLKLISWICLFSFQAFSQEPGKSFDKKNLSKKEIADCKKFRKMNGQDRYDLFQKIRPVFPTAKFKLLSSNTMEMDESSISFIMSEQQLTDLIGKPIVHNGMLDYNLTPEHCCSANFSKLDDGRVFFVSFSNCQDKQDQGR